MAEAGDTLEPYRKKRDFSRSPEPKGRRRKAASGAGLFVVQKHAARRLHYDFRLELDGVLKSWAVTRGPSLDPHEKRLAVQVEDHPLDYGTFEGTIPKGQYGGGTVALWDKGTWTPVGDAAAGLAKGHLEFTLAGTKLKGHWHLVRMKPRRGEAHDNWLLIKGEDAEARAQGAPDILDEQPDSVTSGRPIEAIAAGAPAKAHDTRTGRSPARGKAGTGTARLPDFVAPELATMVTTPPRGSRWLHEVKFDGYRIMARLDHGHVTLLTRTGLDWTARFGAPIAAALGRLPATAALLDGEMVVETAHGASDFSALQAALSAGDTAVFRYYAFDLLHRDGEDLTLLPLTKRRAALEALLAGAEAPLALSGTFAENGDLVLKHACRLSLEGLVSKRKAAPYRSGRGKDWVKSKCARRQEFVVAGYMTSSTARDAIGSLILGLWSDGAFRHVGRVGTGFSVAVACDLYARLQPLRQARSPFAERLTADQARGVTFVAPELVAEVEYRAWTADHQLRHAAFRGLREDKPARDVVAEDEAGVDAPPAPRSRIRLTHPDRVYWPDAGVTKEGLADYYAGVWPAMAPFLVDRPLSLLRSPGGVTGRGFFQKHAWAGAGSAIRRVRDPLAPDEEPLLVVHDLDGLLALVQGGVLEIHPWGATLQALEQPDMLVLDLDPGEGVAWTDVMAAAEEVRDRLAATGLASFVKTSGGKGLHVVAPLRPVAGWDAAKDFAKGLAEAMAADSPKRFLAVTTKAKRHGRILVDYLRNGRGATAVCPYSTRARAGAPVSMPLAWEELGTLPAANHFTVTNALARLDGRGSDPWAEFRAAAAPLPASPRKRRSRATQR